MTSNWSELTPEEKRTRRFEKWLSVDGIEFKDTAAKEAYIGRLTRIIEAIKMNVPDRVPCILPVGTFPAYHDGINLHTAMYDDKASKKAWLRFLHEFESDIFDGAFISSGRLNDILAPKSLKWPGHGLSENAAMQQYVENEYMKADEYDLLINDPSDYCLRYYLPRTTGAFEGFSKLIPFRNIIGMPTSFLGACMDPEVQKSFQAILDATKEMAKMMITPMEVAQEAFSLGYPTLMSNMQAHAPFDILADTLRGTRGIIMDMFRQPEKILEAMDKITPGIIEMVLANASRSKSPIVFFALHKGDDNFISDAQFAEFYWPHFKKVILAFVNEGLVPLLFAEGSYNRRLEIISDLPRASVIWLFDRTDMFKAKEVLGDTACISGNVPASLMYTGTPGEVKEYCRKLIEVCGKGGGFILSGGASVDKVNPGNFYAMMDAAKEYGVFIDPEASSSI
ncbi:MAG: hypothetical protein JW967_09745 [Dehalococcoidales bacterium]|nr:hypothetical protein [Dehalococcoidales bacterium]